MSDDDLVEAEDSQATHSTETLVPVADTGIKHIRPLGRETRGQKRASEKPTAGEATPRVKKPKSVKEEGIKTIMAHLAKHDDMFQEVLREMRNLTASVDNLRTTVTQKMTTIETKIAVQQDRIESLQTARRDGFLNTLTLDTTQTAPLPSIPHFYHIFNIMSQLCCAN